MSIQQLARFIAAMVLMALVAVPAARPMGTNGGGALLVHFDRTIREAPGHTPGDYFEAFAAAGHACDPLGPGEACEEYRLLYPCGYGAGLDPDLDDPAPSVHPPMMWIVAVFPDTTCVEIAAIELGLGAFEGSIDLVGWGSLADRAIATAGWPGEQAGVRLEYDTPLTSHQAALCYISGYVGSHGATTALGPHPAIGTIRFYDASGRATDGVLAPEPCPYAVGAWSRLHEGCDPEVPMVFDPRVCCLEEACRILTEVDCFEAGGRWLPEVETCSATNPCLTPSPIRVCCFGGTCALMTQSACLDAGGSWRPTQSSCLPNPCVSGVARACCLGEICQLLSQYACLQQGGIWLPTLTSCSSQPCARRVCCTGDRCTLLRRQECVDHGGAFVATLSTCTPDPCARRVCCLPGGVCVEEVTEVDCLAQGGTWKSQIDTCAPNPCLTTTTQGSSWGRIKALYRGE